MKGCLGVTIKYIKKEYKSTLTIFIAITLGVMVIVNMILIAQSYVNNSFEKIRLTNGDYDVMLKNITSDKLNKIKNSKSILNYSITMENGVIVSEPVETIFLGYYRVPYTQVYSLDKKTMEEIFKIEVLDGRLPEKENEVVIHKSVLDNMGKNYKIGDIIKASVRENRSVTDYRSIENNMTKDTEAQDLQDEEMITKRKGEYISKSNEYKVVGIVNIPKDNKVLEGKLIKLLNENEVDNTENKFNVIAYLDQEVTDEKIAKELELNYIKKTASMDPFGHRASDIGYPGYNTKEYSSVLTNSIARNVIILAIGFSFIALYNILSYSTQKRIRYYGILRAIGANIQQIFRLIYVEFLILYIFAIPLGIGLGVSLNKLQVKIIKKYLGTLQSYTAILNKETIIITMISMLILISLVVLLTVIKEKSMTPLEAINNTVELTKKKKVKRLDSNGKVHESYEDVGLTISKLSNILKYEKQTLLYKIIKKLFSFEGELAHKNINRNYKINRISKITIILTMSLIIMFFMQIITGSFNADITINSTEWDVSLTSSNAAITSNNIEEVKAIDGVTKVYRDIQVVFPIIIDEAKMTRDFKFAIDFDNIYLGNKGGYNEKYGVIAKVRALDEEGLRLYCNDIKEDDINKLNDGGVFIINKNTNYFLDMNINGVEPLFRDCNPCLTYTKGETFKIAEDDGIISNSMQGKYISKPALQNYLDNNGPTKNVDILGTIESDIFFNNQNIRDSKNIDCNVIMITSEQGIKKLAKEYSENTILVKTSEENREDILKKIKSIAIKNNYKIEDKIGDRDLIKENLKEKTSLNIMVSITAVIISLLNLVNSGIANIYSRETELAAIRAIGMTLKQQKKMIVAEGIILSISAGVITFLTTGVFSFIAHAKNIGIGRISSMSLILGYLVIIICVILINNIIAIILINKAKNINIVEKIKGI